MWYHFCCIYWLQASHKPSKIPREGNEILPTDGGSGERSRRPYGMGDLILILSNLQLRMELVCSFDAGVVKSHNDLENCINTSEAGN